MIKIFGVAILTCSVLGTALASGNQPSALELKQMQTRIFKTTPEKIHRATVEHCQNSGGLIANVPWNALSEHTCHNIRIPAIGMMQYTLSVNGPDSTLVRVRLMFSGAPSWDPSHYGSIFKAIGDMLVLNEVGVEIKVFK